MKKDEEFNKLLTLLERATEERDGFKWQKTPSENVYRMDLPTGHFVRLIREEQISEDEMLPARIVLALCGSNGLVLEEWPSTTLDDSEAERVHDLYRKARRAALNVDKEMRDILFHFEKAMSK